MARKLLDRDITLHDLKITIGKFEGNKQYSYLSLPALSLLDSTRFRALIVAKGPIRYCSFEVTPVECDLDEDVSAVIVFTSAN